jgi:membrane protein DedA with SNARE-associated domain
VFDAIVDAVSDSTWTYALIFAIALLDAFFPLVPSETVVITAGVIAASEDPGSLRIWLIIPVAAVGAIIGDNVSYGLGRTLGNRIRGRLFGGNRERHLKWAEHQLEVRGGYVIVVARFIPGGRTAVTFTCGLIPWRWRRFIFFDIIAGFIWATYASLLGYVGGKAFEKEPWKGLLVAFAVAMGIAGAIEVFRWYRKRAAQQQT